MNILISSETEKRWIELDCSLCMPPPPPPPPQFWAGVSILNFSSSRMLFQHTFAACLLTPDFHIFGSQLSFTAVSCDHVFVMVDGFSEGEALLCSLMSKTVVGNYHFHNKVHQIKFSPDGTWVDCHQTLRVKCSFTSKADVAEWVKRD